MVKTFLISPNEEEVTLAAKKLGVEKEVLLSALDENALSRVHFNKITALYVDIPFVTKHSKQTIYKTSPFGLFFTDEYFVVVASRELELIDKMKNEACFMAENGMDLMLLALNDITGTYLMYLKDFYEKIEKLEEQLKKNLSNNGIFQLMEYQRSLTDLSTSISGIKRLLNKIEEKNLPFKNENLLDDTIVAAEQATEMAHIYSEDLDSLMDAFGSVISNNVNQVMKILTSLTLIIAIPTLVAGLYGMNVSHLPLADQPYAFWAILGGSAVISMALGVLFYLKKML